jgi:hypothetical protein
MDVERLEELPAESGEGLKPLVEEVKSMTGKERRSGPVALRRSSW